MTSPVVSVDPRTGRAVETVAAESEPEDVESACRSAAAAAPWWEDLGGWAGPRRSTPSLPSWSPKATTSSCWPTGRPPSANPA